MVVESQQGPAKDGRGGGGLEFRLPDPEHSYSRVRLDAGLGTSGPRPELVWEDGVWSVRVDLPPLHRVEYGFEITQTIADPCTDERVESGFGPRSVVEMPGYTTPAWLAIEPAPGTTTEIETSIPGVSAWLWAPQGLDETEGAPLVVVHDGPDYAERGGLTHYLGVLAEEGAIAPTRALLLSAEPREVLYPVSDAYAEAIAQDVLPAVTDRWPTTRRIGVGASLGALAALHLQWRHPGTFDGLLLQSGSFFTPGTDPQESGFARWDEITRFVAVVLSDDDAARLPATAITCGGFEENAANNRLLATRLREVGVPVSHVEIADLHNFTCWRDTLDPALRDLIGPAAA